MTERNLLQDKVTAAIYRAIDDVNPQLPPSSRLEKARDTVLFGRKEGLDSLGLVNLIVALEGHIEKGFGQAVSLSLTEMMFAPESPFSNVCSLGDYVTSLLQESASRDQRK